VESGAQVGSVPLTHRIGRNKVVSPVIGNKCSLRFSPGKFLIKEIIIIKALERSFGAVIEARSFAAWY
jgi:hypothetical protein